ncbi:MAG TPA: FAD binding domain-containing protein, partial [Anaerolineaceae bacterium]|nr:FAD binding domain-containing protein [Anaerolineaceae bacterium]
MIREYHRPETIETAVELLSRTQPHTLPLGGGTRINQPGAQVDAVVDLQALGLDQIERQGNLLRVGAMVTLQRLFEQADLPEALKKAIHQETSHNLRQVATLAGTLVSADGRSPLAAVALAMDARLVWAPGEQDVSYGEFLPLREGTWPGRLITRIDLPLQAKTAFQMVARTPDDFPLVSAALVRWPSGRRRLALGGYGAAPLLVLDGTGEAGLEETARDAYSQAGDTWAS